MEFVETKNYTEDVEDLLTPEEQRELQSRLISRPNAGAVIRGTGGCRKLRVRMRGRGKSGGGRVIYYWIDEKEKIYLLHIYDKTKQEDLTPEQAKTLAVIAARMKE